MAGVVDGQGVNAAVTNPAFLFKNANDTSTVIYTLANTDPSSGATVSNIQQTLNAHNKWTGAPSNNPASGLPPWDANYVGASGNDLFTRAEALTHLFHGTTGHAHTGANGDGPVISATTLTGVLPIAHGGTGGATASAGFNDLSPLGTKGDILGFDTSNRAIPVGADGQFIQADSTQTLGVKYAPVPLGSTMMEWSPEGPNSPVASSEFNFDVFLFDTGADQDLYGCVKVPSGYNTGNPINLYMTVYSPDIINSIAPAVTGFLLRDLTDQMNSRANAHVATIPSIDLFPGGAPNLRYSIVADITDGSGQINGVVVHPNDLILVHFSRSTIGGDAADPMRLVNTAVEVTFK